MNYFHLFPGDNRVGEAPNLQMNHMVFVREHNRIATKLHYMNPNWSNEKVFQETRRIIIAIHQHVTYNHYLPTVIDQQTMKYFGLFSRKKGFNYVYDNHVDASILNSFGAGPWRFGHSQIMSEQSLLREDLTTVDVHKLEDNFESPHLCQKDFGTCALILHKT